MPLMDKQRRAIDTRRPNYATFKKRRRIGLLVLVILAALILGSLGAYLFSGTSEETPEEPAVKETSPEEQAPAETEEESAPVVPDDPTLFLTVPRLGIYGHTVRNDASEYALDLG
ncbi:MAG: hypothetical protein LC740_17905, partial [Actinobacteria bacterium]|nr:hypothetical protein [Actinomycetota bacterium]